MTLASLCDYHATNNIACRCVKKMRSQLHDAGNTKRHPQYRFDAMLSGIIFMMLNSLTLAECRIVDANYAVGCCA